MPAPTYLEQEKALERAALQVETMGAIIGWLLASFTPSVTISAEELRHNHEQFNVVVTPNQDKSITITLKEKNG